MELSKEELLKLKNLVKEKTGINIDDSKLFKIYKIKFEKLLNEKGYSSVENFLKDLENNSSLLSRLIETVTVNETYFFRENYQFETLVKTILPDLVKEKKEIKILCAPCSSGEEVYSIAIYLLEEKDLIDKADFILVGIDIDKTVIEKAKSGIFNKRSVQKLPFQLLEKYFDKVSNERYQIKDFIRKSVTFETANILKKEDLEKLGKFDVIFSRNLLIYFDEKTREKALMNFYSLLHEGGYLFLGHAEKIPPTLSSIFKREKLGESFVYRKVSTN